MLCSELFYESTRSTPTFAADAPKRKPEQPEEKVRYAFPADKVFELVDSALRTVGQFAFNGLQGQIAFEQLLRFFSELFWDLNLHTT